MAGWPQNFITLALGVLAIGGASVSWFWPANYNPQSGYILVLCATFVIPLLIACPFISEKEAKEKARKFAEENLHGATSIRIDAAKLNDWTWIVNGWRIQTYGTPIQFWANVHAKTGTPSNLRYKE